MVPIFRRRHRTIAGAAIATIAGLAEFAHGSPQTIMSLLGGEPAPPPSTLPLVGVGLAGTLIVVELAIKARKHQLTMAGGSAESKGGARQICSVLPLIEPDEETLAAALTPGHPVIVVAGDDAGQAILERICAVLRQCDSIVIAVAPDPDKAMQWPPALPTTADEAGSNLSFSLVLQD